MAQSSSLISNQTISTEPEKKDESEARVFFNMLQKAGSFGKYQKITTFLYCIIGYLCGGLMLIIPFLFYQDPYDCHGDQGNQTCYDYVCNNPDQSEDFRTQYIPPKSMYTLANQFGDYRCSKQKLVLDSVITIMYIGTVVGFLILSVIGDLFGRKLLLSICCGISALGMIITIFCANITMAGIGLFIASVGIQNAFNICFYFIAETISQEYREKASVAIQLFYGLGVLLNVLWYFAVGDWKIIFAVFYFIPMVGVTIGAIIFLRDTPICLVMRNSPLKALRDFRYIAKMNNKSDFSLTVEQIEEVKANYGSGDSKQVRKFSILDLFKFKSLRGMTLMLILLQCTIIFQFYAPALMLDKFKLNIFINGLVVGVSQILSYPLCYFLIMKTKRRLAAYACFAGTFLCSVILTFIWNQQDQNPNIGESIGVLVLIFIFRFAISVQYTFFYVYFNECYPTQIRVIGTSMVSVMGGAMVTIAPEIIDGCIHAGFPIMILFAVLSGLSALCSWKLPETLNKTPPDVIQQLTYDLKGSILTNPEQSSEGLQKGLLQKDGKTSTNYSSSEPDAE